MNFYVKNVQLLQSSAAGEDVGSTVGTLHILGTANGNAANKNNEDKKIFQALIWFSKQIRRGKNYGLFLP